MTPIESPQDAPAAFQAAWNAHDMAAFGALFQADASFVNRFGRLVRGVDAIVEMHRAIHETIYRDCTLANALISVDEVAADVAVVHFWSRFQAGPSHPAGPHDADTLFLAVLTRRDGAWRIQAAENVTLADPRTGATVLRD